MFVSLSMFSVFTFLVKMIHFFVLLFRYEQNTIRTNKTNKQNYFLRLLPNLAPPPFAKPFLTAWLMVRSWSYSINIINNQILQASPWLRVIYVHAVLPSHFFLFLSTKKSSTERKTYHINIKGIFTNLTFNSFLFTLLLLLKLLNLLSQQQHIQHTSINSLLGWSDWPGW